MYLNKAILMGFLGGDAVVRTGKNNKQFTTFSLATKTSYKNKETGKYNERTEWHNAASSSASSASSQPSSRRAHTSRSRARFGTPSTRA